MALVLVAVDANCALVSRTTAGKHFAGYQWLSPSQALFVGCKHQLELMFCCSAPRIHPAMQDILR